MTDDAPPKDSDLITVYDLVKVLGSHYDAILALSSCTLNLAAGLRQSQNEAEHTQGEEAWKKLEEVIAALEKITDSTRELLKSKGIGDGS